jgi:hypothetical protein
MSFRVALDETDSDEDDELLNFSFATEAAKRRRLAGPVRDQVARARRVGAAAKPRAAPVRPSPQARAPGGPLLSRLPETCRGRMRELHGRLVAFLQEDTMQDTHSYSLCASIGLAIERILHPTDKVFADTLQRSTRLQLGTRDEDGLEMLATLLRSYKTLSDVWGYDAGGHAHTWYEDKMHMVHVVYGCTYPISDVLFRNLARAAAGRPLDVHDGVLGRSGNKWEAHSGSTRPGEFCDFDGAQGRAMRALFLDYCNELS